MTLLDISLWIDSHCLSLAFTVCRKPEENTEEIITNVPNLERDQSSQADMKTS